MITDIEFSLSKTFNATTRNKDLQSVVTRSLSSKILIKYLHTLLGSVPISPWQVSWRTVLSGKWRSFVSKLLLLTCTVGSFSTVGLATHITLIYFHQRDLSYKYTNMNENGLILNGQQGIIKVHMKWRQFSKNFHVYVYFKFQIVAISVFFII